MAAGIITFFYGDFLKQHFLEKSVAKTKKSIRGMRTLYKFLCVFAVLFLKKYCV
jgi:hypothetical protein